MWIFLIGSWIVASDVKLLEPYSFQKKAVLSEAFHIKSQLPIASRVFESFQMGLTSEIVQRFVKAFEMSSSGPITKVDSDAIRLALRFYAPRFFTKANPELTVKLTFPSQEQEAFRSAFFEKLVKDFSSRGWSVSQKSLTSSPGKFELIWENEAGQDSEHSETHFVLRGVMKIDGLPEIEEKYEILNGMGEFATLERLLWEIHIDTGYQEEIRDLTKRSDSNQTYLIEITGVDDFEVYAQMKAALQGHLSGSVVEERSFKRGRTLFEVSTSLSKTALNELLKDMSLPPIASQSLGISLK